MDNLSDLYAERIQAWRKATARMSYSAIDPKRNAVALYDALTQLEEENEELRNAGQESATMLRRFLGFGPSTKLELLLTEQEPE